MNNNTNYNAKEIKHFSTLSEHWWNKNGPLRTLHDINPSRIKFILNHVDLDNKTVLDVGCGGGILSEALAKAGAKVTAIDLESNAIETAIAHAQKKHLDIQYQYIAVETLLEESNQRFDVITCMELLEHVPNPAQIIHSCAALLKPNGKLFLSTINRTWKAYCFAIIGAEHLLNIVPKHTHQYEHFIRPSEMAEWLRHEKLSLTALSGLNYNPFTHDARLTDNFDINYLMVAENKETSKNNG